MNFLRAVSSTGTFTILSRITGYLRDLLVAHFIGVNALSDALTLAIKLPSFFRRLFAEGAFHVSFLPVFAGLLKANRATAFKFAGQVLTLLLSTLALCVLLGEWQLSTILPLFFPGLRSRPETLRLVIQLSQITFPYILFISLASFFGSILNSFGRFALLAASHAIGNLFIIICFFSFRKWTQNYGTLFCWGVLGSGILQFLCVAGACWIYGYRPRLRWPRFTPAIKGFLRKLGPGIMGVGALQANLLIGFYLGSRLPAGGLSYLYYADRLNQLPLSIIGVSLSIVLLPLLSQHIQANKVLAANRTQDQALRFSMSLVLPITALLIGLAFPIVRLMFGNGKLSLHDLQQVSYTLMIYAWGIPANIALKVLNTRFFAAGQTRIAFQGSVVNLIVDVGIALVLMPHLHHLGLACAVTAAAWANLAFLVGRFYRYKTWVPSRKLWRFLTRLGLICIGVAMGLRLIQKVLPTVTSFWGQALNLIVLSSLSGLVIISLAFLWRLVTIRQLRVLWNAAFKNTPTTHTP